MWQRPGRARSSFFPILPNCAKKKLQWNFNISVWTELLGLPGGKSFKGTNMNEALETFSERLKTESPFADGTLKAEMGEGTQGFGERDRGPGEKGADACRGR